MRFFSEKVALEATFAAKVYKNRFWSVIPLLGSRNSQRAKHPAIPWRRYQHSLASDPEIEDWFIHQGYDAIGIVLGRVSRLVVLDFDDAARVSEFRHLYPHLTDTYTVQSGNRHLPHYYYALPDGLNVASRHVPGVDLRADGTYVVAPPTRVGDAEWRLVDSRDPHVLGADDLRAITRFLAAIMLPEALKRSETPSRSIMGCSVRRPSADDAGASEDGKKCRNSDTPVDPAAFYKARAVYGRNNALFDAAALARDHGWDENRTRELLAGLHAVQPDSSGQRESVSQRYAEALGTIKSVYSRPARVRKAAHQATVGIPTPVSDKALWSAVREGLLQRDLVAAARVIDGLYLAGLKVGSSFTEREACQRLSAFGIGRRTVMAALKTQLPDGSALFAHAANSPYNPHTYADAAIQTIDDGRTKCDLVTGAKRVKSRGRPARRYLLPEAEGLAQRLGVGIPTPRSADHIEANDLSSPAAYRRGLHRELVKRRPGQYTRRWLGERLGVSKWTCRRYEAKLEMQVQPTYTEQRVTWTNMETLLPPTASEAQPGTFLEADGKRYPPLRPIAMWLLGSGRAVWFKRREGNVYRMVDSCLLPVASRQAEVSSQVGGVGIPTPLSQKTDSSHSHQNNLKVVGKAIQFVDQEKTCQRTENRSEGVYSASTNASIYTANGQSKSVGIPTLPAIPPDTKPNTFWFCPTCLKTHFQPEEPSLCQRCGSNEWQRIPETIWKNQYELKRWWQAVWRKKNPNAPRQATPLIRPDRTEDTKPQPARLDPIDESVAQTAQRHVRGLSLKSARKLVSTYGARAVNQAVRRIGSREGVNKPSGLLVTILRSEHLFYFPKKERQAAGHHSVAWVQAMSDSTDVEFLVNADEFLSW